MPDLHEGRDVYLSYTHALRHPVIVGQVAGWRLPWALSAIQLGTVAVAAAVMLVTRPLWSHFGGVGNLLIFCVVVGGSGWLVRHWRIEGRSPIRVGLGLLMVWTSPGSHRGTRGGRPVSAPWPKSGLRVGLAVESTDG